MQHSTVHRTYSTKHSYFKKDSKKSVLFGTTARVIRVKRYSSFVVVKSNQGDSRSDILSYRLLPSLLWDSRDAGHGPHDAFRVMATILLSIVYRRGNIGYVKPNQTFTRPIASKLELLEN